MKINIASVLKNDGASMNFSKEMELGDFDFLGSNISFKAPVRIEGKISNMGGTLEITGNAVGSYTAPCSRCNETVSMKLDAEIFESVESDFSDVDEDSLSLCGTVLDIGGAVRACIFNGIPLKFLCREDCKGLCPQCGINLNENECNCETEDYDPRFAIFRKLSKEV